MATAKTVGRWGLSGAATLCFMGCGPAVATDGSAGDGSSSTSSSADSVSGAGPAPMPSSSPPDPTLPPITSATGEPPSTTSTGASTGDSGALFLIDPDVPPGGFDCDLFLQDCGPGEKCTSWVSEGSYWDSTRCVPVADRPDGVGESCMVEGGGTTGLDSCDAASMCFNVDPDTNVGECFAFCSGSPANPSCEPGHVCPLSGNGSLALCYPTCDPVAADPCDGPEVCIPYDGTFLCAPATDPAGSFLDPCEFLNACDAGLFCAPPDGLDGCRGGAGCCAPFCSLEQPECPGTTTCKPFFDEGEAPEGFERVGACLD